MDKQKMINQRKTKDIDSNLSQYPPLILNKDAVIKLAAFFCSSLYMKMNIITFNDRNGISDNKDLSKADIIDYFRTI